MFGSDSWLTSQGLTKEVKKPKMLSHNTQQNTDSRCLLIRTDNAWRGTSTERTHQQLQYFTVVTRKRYITAKNY